ncbi:hypothetical protein GCM10011583_62100 [Streptomyces camponoticapitis]|uniref:LTD domain-containing protein n=1 Tax=Streptomyces camponoticapitis TaxID=1616125 RepID=A0ABQ2ETK6_9ACTN|nr:lamin tail domain-containing protein [Streptomyces camponoticapitis]GGK21690.1 hypothetical protein GCM10011583_62100 [Streptomyces camponoticapitis]
MSTSVSVRRTAALVLAAGALVGAAALPVSADGGHRAPRNNVVLGEIQYDSPGRDTRSNHSLNGEWVEVANKGRSRVNLDGWTLSNSDGNRYRFDNLRLGARSTVRVHTGHGRVTRTDVYQDRRTHMWSNRSDTATLRNDRGRTVDSESWGRGNRH